MAIGFLATAGLIVAEQWFVLFNSAWLPGHFRIHVITANNTQQLLDVKDMDSFGPRALWYDHVYPPLVDSVRYLLMLPETMRGYLPSGDYVDERLYFIFAAFFGLVATLIYLWVRDLTRSGWWALGAALLWAITPASVITMTLLEPTPPAVATITLTYYLLYRFLKTRHLGYAAGFFAALLVASLTRNVVQIHVFVIVVIALVAFWFMARKRSVWILVLNVVLVGLMFLWPLRAHIMFGTWDVSTHTGYHRIGGLWVDPRTVVDPSFPLEVNVNGLVFSSRFNTRDTVVDNYRYQYAANNFMREHPIESVVNLSKSLRINVENGLLPVSATTENFLTKTFPWGGALDWVFSGWRYVLLLVASVIAIILRRGWPGTWRLARRYAWFAVFWVLVAIPVAFGSNRYWPPGSEDSGPIHTEAARLKAFIEVPVFVLIAYGLWVMVSMIRRRSIRGHREPMVDSAAVSE